ncbi:DUF4333 domain-containing protein [Gordonia sp. (in: high G+C Gram-positive bacteria)]|uniref:DUF4333 domain-containing protein n=1 Tax=Gordonia sp. (in: high G+C Gram-positive bacteria) TaxID=84139 RepID=UPI0039E545DC
MRNLTKIGVVGIAGVAMVLTSSCTASTNDSATTSKVPSAGVEQLQTKVKESISEKVGKQPDEVKCKGGLEFLVGAKQECALRVGQSWLPVDVTATDTEGNFDAQVGKDKIPAPTW